MQQPVLVVLLRLLKVFAPSLVSYSPFPPVAEESVRSVSEKKSETLGCIGTTRLSLAATCRSFSHASTASLTACESMQSVLRLVSKYQC